MQVLRESGCICVVKQAGGPTLAYLHGIDGQLDAWQQALSAALKHCRKGQEHTSSRTGVTTTTWVLDK